MHVIFSEKPYFYSKNLSRASMYPILFLTLLPYSDENSVRTISQTLSKYIEKIRLKRLLEWGVHLATKVRE